MSEFCVIAPVLGRPQSAQPLAESLWSSAPLARLVFVCSPDDREQFEACDATGADVAVANWPAGPADYARKINLGYSLTDEELVLCGADDLRFRAGWLEAVLAAAEFDCGVIGTNDLANPSVLAGRHSTHPVVRRCYVDARGGVVGEPGRVYFEGYDHNYPDNELCATAQARGCYFHAFDAVVEHLHPLWRSAPDDATYRKGRLAAARDARLFEQRRHLWLREAVAV